MKKNKFKILYYTGLCVRASVLTIIIIVIISVGSLVVSKFDKQEIPIVKQEIPIVKQIIYDTISVYDTIKYVATPRPKTIWLDDRKQDKDSI